MKEWKRAKTTRLYLQPPKSERIYTVWRDGKIMLGEIEAPINKEYSDITASGFMLVGAACLPADFCESSFSLREDGIPIHKLLSRYGNLSAEIECFTDFSRLASCHVRVTLCPIGDGGACEKIGFIIRTDKEEKLISGAPDLYCPYESGFENWLNSKSDWQFKDGLWRNGDAFLACDKSELFDFDESRGVALCDVALAPGESVKFTFTLGKGEYRDYNYDLEKENTLMMWQGELARINKLSEKIIYDKEKERLIKNLTVQLLQCFCYAVGENELYSRQGGLQRRVWTYEAMTVLEALARLGDFDDYIEPVIDVYFNSFYTETGEIVPLGIHWAMASGTVLDTFGTYALRRDKEYFSKYREKAFKTFEWIRTLRTKTSYSGSGTPEYEKKVSESARIIPGLFPPMASCDDPLVFQAWHTTDVHNLVGIKSLLDVCELYGDPDTDAVRKEYESYLGVLHDAFEVIERRAEGSDELEIPHSLSDNNAQVTEAFEFPAPHGFVVNALDFKPKQYEKVLNYYTRRGFMKGGLLNKMPDKACPGAPEAFLDENGESPIWYVCSQEYHWFKCFMRHNERKKCQSIIEDNIAYAMTDEYYMLERYNKLNEWYSPWSPNASCSGRLINMMLDFYS